MKTKGVLVPGFLSKHIDFIENVIFLGRLDSFWQKLVKAAAIQPADKVVDIGCGSGKLTSMLARQLENEGEIVGLDASERMIRICQKNNRNNRLKFMVGVMENLPFQANTFDKVISSLAIHHVPKEAKQKAFSEFKRVLKKGGQLFILDHGKPYNLISKILMFPMRWNFVEYQRENFRGEIPSMIKKEFDNVVEIDRFFGWIRIWKAEKE